MNQTKRTIQLLTKGWLTALESAQQGGCLSLSQRVGELRRGGAVVIDKWIETPAGARIKSYRLILPTRWTA
jgi:hypothetical protein